MRIYICFPEGKFKAFTMSYDDGVTQDFRLVPIFNKNGIKGTFNINSGLFGKISGSNHERFSSDQVTDLYRGHEIATHTLTHPTIERSPMTLVAQEILEDRRNLEALTGQIIRGHAYPNGSYSEEIKTLFKSLGIAYARVVPSSYSFDLPTDPMEWHPTCHHNDKELMDLAETFVEDTKRQYLKLFYVWGHAFELDDRDNWDLMENFCSYMGRHSDIWYATNIEIIDYLTAAHALQFSADSSMVHNPSAIPVWLEINDTTHVKIDGGATVHLESYQ